MVALSKADESGRGSHEKLTAGGSLFPAVVSVNQDSNHLGKEQLSLTVIRVSSTRLRAARSKVAARVLYSLALHEDGTLYFWGHEPSGSTDAICTLTERQFETEPISHWSAFVQRGVELEF